jgi:hypothetical protein
MYFISAAVILLVSLEVLKCKHEIGIKLKKFYIQAEPKIQ